MLGTYSAAHHPVAHCLSQTSSQSAAATKAAGLKVQISSSIEPKHHGKQQETKTASEAAWCPN
jgi:hypothetical protein